MNRSRTIIVAVAVLVTLAFAVLIASSLIAPPATTESTYAYSVTLGTDATLANLTLLVPLPAAADGTAPVAAAIRDGNATVPEGWRAAVVETGSGPVLRLEAAAVPAAARPDGRQYSTYQFGVTVPAGDAIDTGDPFGPEPTVSPVDGLRERPCPNLATPDPGQTCYAFDAAVSVSYNAPAGAAVTIDLVHTGANVDESGRHRMYYERLSLALDGPQDGSKAVTGFASTEDDG